MESGNAIGVFKDLSFISQAVINLIHSVGSNGDMANKDSIIA